MASEEEAAVIEAARTWRNTYRPDNDREHNALVEALDALERSQAPKSLREAIEKATEQFYAEGRNGSDGAFYRHLTVAVEAFIKAKRDEIAVELPVAGPASTRTYFADAVIALLVGDEG